MGRGDGRVAGYFLVGRVVYVSDSKAAQLESTLTSLNKISTLTVSDITDFSKSGGIISFVTRDKKIAIEIGMLDSEKDNCKCLADSYAATNQSEKAYLNLVRYIQLTEEFKNEELLYF